MRVRAGELSDVALDWAVASAQGLLAFGWENDMGLLDITLSTGEHEYFNPSLDWAQGGPIIERERIELTYYGDAQGWAVYAGRIVQSAGIGHTPLIAAMRCYVASKLGDEVDVPDKLVKEAA